MRRRMRSPGPPFSDELNGTQTGGTFTEFSKPFEKGDHQFPGPTHTYAAGRDGTAVFRTPSRRSGGACLGEYAGCGASTLQLGTPELPDEKGTAVSGSVIDGKGRSVPERRGWGALICV